MRDVYQGPAVLLGKDGVEIPVRAQLGPAEDAVKVTVEPMGATIPNPFSWAGVLDSDTVLDERRISLPAELRFPSGAVGRVEAMRTDEWSAGRILIAGMGAAPWEVNGSE